MPLTIVDRLWKKITSVLSVKFFSCVECSIILAVGIIGSVILGWTRKDLEALEVWRPGGLEAWWLGGLEELYDGTPKKGERELSPSICWLSGWVDNQKRA